jgi:hypothetical protein
LQPVGTVDVPGLPKEFAAPKLPDIVPEGCFAVLKYLDYGDTRLTLAVDVGQPDISAADRARLTDLESQLDTLAKKPECVYRRIASPEKAAWTVQVRDGRIVLVDGATAVAEPPRPLTRMIPHFYQSDSDPSASLITRLETIFKSQNLLRICRPPSSSDRAPPADASQRTADVRINVEMFRYRDEAGNGEQPVVWEQGMPVVHPGEFVGWRVTNRGWVDVDITLLYVDSEYAIQSVYPTRRSVGTVNRLSSAAPGNAYRTRPIQVTDSTLGTEHLAVIALRAEGPPRDFRLLAESNLGTAKGLEMNTRGPDDNVINSPLGKLLMHSVFGEPLNGEGLRGSSVDGDLSSDDHTLISVSWMTVPETPRTSP